MERSGWNGSFEVVGVVVRVDLRRGIKHKHSYSHTRSRVYHRESGERTSARSMNQNRDISNLIVPLLHPCKVRVCSSKIMRVGLIGDRRRETSYYTGRLSVRLTIENRTCVCSASRSTRGASIIEPTTVFTPNVASFCAFSVDRTRTVISRSSLLGWARKRLRTGLPR